MNSLRNYDLYHVCFLSFIVFSFPSWQRIKIKEIKSHPWFLKNLPRELTEAAQAMYYERENPSFSLQCVEDIMKIVEEAKVPPPASRSIGGFGWGGVEDGDSKEEVDAEEEEDEYEKKVKEAQESGEVNIS
jgi:serine/threonine-protein kinase SRK2